MVSTNSWVDAFQSCIGHPRSPQRHGRKTGSEGRIGEVVVSQSCLVRAGKCRTSVQSACVAHDGCGDVRDG